MNKNLLYVIIITILFMGKEVLTFIGWEQDTFFPMRYTPFVFLLIPVLFQSGLYSSYRFREERNTLLLFAFVGVVSIVLSRFGSVSVLFGILLPPILLSVALYSSDRLSIREPIRKILLLFYLTECLLAIFEKMTGTTLFKSDYSTDDIFYGFRASALHGHPLSNALLVSTIMAFLLISPYYTYTKKLILFGLGYVALLCFNTRSSIMVMAVVFIIHFTLYIFSSRRSIVLKSFYAALIYVFVSIISYLILFSGMGGRLVEHEIMDSSANARLEIVDVYLNLTLKDFMLGIGNKQMLHLAEIKVNGGHTENYWILFAASFGLVLFIPIVYSFYKLYKKYFIGTGYLTTFITAGTFIIVSSTNNSLFFQSAPLCMFMLCAYAMMPCKNRS